MKSEMAVETLTGNSNNMTKRQTDPIKVRLGTGVP